MIKINEAELRRVHALYKQGQIGIQEMLMNLTAFIDGKPIDTTNRDEAIRQYHIKRGCCDSNPSEACIPKVEPKRRGRAKEPNEFEGTE